MRLSFHRWKGKKKKKIPDFCAQMASTKSIAKVLAAHVAACIFASDFSDQDKVFLFEQLPGSQLGNSAT